MPSKKSASIHEYFADKTDPRRREGTYPLINFVVISLCAVICGADDFVAIAEFGRKKKKLLERFLDLSEGIPSHDRFNAILGAIKPAEFEKRRWWSGCSYIQMAVCALCPQTQRKSTVLHKIPAELSFGSIYFPPFLLVVALGFVCAFCLSKVLHITGFRRFFWHDGLVFVTFWVLLTSLIGLLVLPP